MIAHIASLAPEAFWVFMDNRSWSHLYDRHGVRQDHRKLAKSVTGLIDDPFRSLAGAPRRAGGYAKDTTALGKALKRAKAEAASFLPGWCGSVTG